MENYIAIGDIHGRNDLLTALLENPDVARRLDSGKYKAVFLGDMIDRGPDSFTVISKIKDMVETGWAIAVLGNHEDLMLDYFRDGIWKKHSVWTMNGGHHTMKSYNDQYKKWGPAHFFETFKRSGHDKWLASLPYYYETDAVWFSHAPIPKMSFRKRKEGDFRADREALTWSWHGDFGADESDFAHEHGKLAVCGHVHALQQNILTPRIYDNIIYADTGSGCAPWGPLTAIVITDGKFEKYLQAIPKEKMAT